MRKIELIDFRGELVAKLDLPENPSEVRFRQFVNFTKTLDRVQEVAEKTPELHPIKYLASLCEVLSEFFEIDIVNFYDVDLQSLENEEAVDMEKSVVGLINYLQKVCIYEPKLRDESNHRFKYQGEQFEIPHYRASVYLKDLLNRPDITVGEAVEALEIDRIKEPLLVKDDHGSEWFTKGLTTIAILCRKPGESFPEDPAQSKQFINERMHFFADIDMVTVQDVAFFLKSTMRTLSKIQLSSTSLTRQSRLSRQRNAVKQ